MTERKYVYESRYGIIVPMKHFRLSAETNKAKDGTKIEITSLT